MWDNIVTIIAGFCMFSIVNSLFLIKVGPDINFSIMNSINSVKYLFQHYYQMTTQGGLKSIIMFLVFSSFVTSAIIAFRLLFKISESRKKDNEVYLFYFLFFTSFFLIAFLTPGIITVYNSPDCLRYNAVILYFSMLNTGLIFEYLIVKKTINRHYFTFIFCLLFTMIGVFAIYKAKSNNPLSCIDKVNSYYPSLVKASDQLAVKYNCKNGIGDYWDTRLITSLSKNGIRINSVFTDLKVYFWACNYQHYFWDNYDKTERIIYNFIVLNRFNDTTTIYNTFNPNKIKKVNIEDYQFYIVPEFTFNEDDYHLELLKAEE
jgi:hypothetical protein